LAQQAHVVDVRDERRASVGASTKSKGLPAPLWQKFSVLFVALSVVLGSASLTEVSRLQAADAAQVALMRTNLQTIQKVGTLWGSFNRYDSELQTFTTAALTGQAAARQQSLRELTSDRDEIQRALPSLGTSGLMVALRPKLDRYFAASDAARKYVLQGKPAAALRLEASRVGYLSDQVAAALQNVRARAEEGAMAAETKEQESAHALDLQIVMTILFAIALTAMAAVVAARYLTRRLAALTSQAAAVSRGEGDIQLAAVRFPDEIDTLTQALVTMTGHLRERADEVRATQWQVLEELVSALEQRDAYSAGHSRRVMVYAVHLARRLGLPAHEVEVLRRAALVHDIGKIALPGGFLDSSGALTDEQWVVMRRHCQVGVAILEHVPWLTDILPAVRGHHERWDGFGYPDGLAYEAIPRLARILAVADAYDAMTTTRSYRNARSPQQALEILRQGAGSQWDPDCVREMATMIGTDPKPFVPDPTLLCDDAAAGADDRAHAPSA